jgi:hypothetical protein
MASDFLTKQAVMMAQAGEDISHMINPKYTPEQRDLIMEGARRGRDIGRFLLQEESATPDRGVGWDLVDAVNSTGAGLEQGLVNTGLMPVNLIRKAIANKGEYKPIEFDIDKHNIQGKAKNKFLKGVGEFTGEVVGGLAIPGGAVTRGAKALNIFQKGAGKVAKTALKAGDIGAEGAAAGALYGSQEADSDIGSDAVTGAAINYPVAGMFKLPSYALTKYLRGAAAKAARGESEALTRKQVEQIDQDVGDLPVDAGTMMGNKTITNIYRDIVANLPFSNAKKDSSKVVGKVQREAENLKQRYGGNIDETKIPEEIVSHMSKKQKAYEKRVGRRFEAAGKIAEESKVNMTEIDDLVEEASKLHGALKSRKAIPGAQKKFIKEIADLKQMTKADNMNTSYYPFTPGKKILSFGRLDSIRKDLGTYAREAELDKDKTLHSSLSRLEKLTHDAIENSLEKNGAKEAVTLWKEGRELHRKNVIPYRKPEIQRIIQGKKSNEKIHDILLKGDPENKKVFSDLSDDLVDKVVRSRLFGGAIEEVGGKQRINTAKLVKEYTKLNEHQKRRVFDKSQRENLDKFVQLHKMAGTARLLLEPPKTGKYVYNAGIKAATMALPAYAGVISHDTESGSTGARNALLTLLAGAAISKKASKYMTSRNGLRKDYIRGKATQSKASEVAQKAISRAITKGLVGKNDFD